MYQWKNLSKYHTKRKTRTRRSNKTSSPRIAQHTATCQGTDLWARHRWQILEICKIKHIQTDLWQNFLQAAKNQSYSPNTSLVSWWHRSLLKCSLTAITINQILHTCNKRTQSAQSTRTRSDNPYDTKEPPNENHSTHNIYIYIYTTAYYTFPTFLSSGSSCKSLWYLNQENPTDRSDVV
jgi:hypothetical protein